MTKMKVYLLHGMSSVIDVEADSVDEAIEKAYGIADFQPCHQCNNSFEPDGEAEVVVVYGPDGETVWDKDEAPAQARRTAADAARRVGRYLDELEKQPITLDADASEALLADLRALVDAAR
jgi:hypothetical protein